jgi:hypothetical protein
MTSLRRVRLYGILSSEEQSKAVTIDSIKQSPRYKPAHLALTDAAFNYCAMSLASLFPFLAGSANTLTSLCLEGPCDITHQDLLVLLAEVGTNLRMLEVEDFPSEGNSKATSDRTSSSDSSGSTLHGPASTKPRPGGVIDVILRTCPKLRRLDFIEGVASEDIFEGISLGNLQEFRFTCALSVRWVWARSSDPDYLKSNRSLYRPSHWLDAIARQYFRKGSKGRIESLGEASLYSKCVLYVDQVFAWPWQI